MSRPVFAALIAAVAAIALRYAVPGLAESRALFAVPAIILTTVLLGTGAGSAAALLGLALLWASLARPPGPQGALTLAAFAIVAAALVAAIGRMRRALVQHRLRCLQLEQQVEIRTAERNRLWERSSELIAILAADGAIQTANPALLRALGLPLADLSAHDFRRFLIEEDAGLPGEARARLHGPGLAAGFRARLVTPAGLRHVDWTMMNDDGWFYLAGRDLTGARLDQGCLHPVSRPEAPPPEA